MAHPPQILRWNRKAYDAHGGMGEDAHKRGDQERREDLPNFSLDELSSCCMLVFTVQTIEEKKIVDQQ